MKIIPLALISILCGCSPTVEKKAKAVIETELRFEITRDGGVRHNMFIYTITDNTNGMSYMLINGTDGLTITPLLK